MLSALILLSAAQADPAVSLEATARPLHEVLKSLSEKSGQSHTSSVAHANEVVLIRFKNRPVSEVRRKLAWALDASWTQTETGWVLARSELRTREIAAEAATIRRKEVEDLFARVRERVKNSPSAYDRKQTALKAVHKGNLDEPWNAGPAGYWLRQIWLELGVDATANSPSEGALTYSDQPNANQKALPPGALKALTRMQDELIELGQETDRVTVHTNFGRRPMKTIFKLYRMGSAYRIWMTTYGHAGERMYHAGQGSWDFGFSPYSSGDELGRRAPNETFALSKLSAEFEKVREPNAEISGLYREVPQVKVSPELTQSLLNPETTDPLSFWTSEAMLQWAGEKSVCAVLPDRLEFAARFCLSPGKFQLGKFKVIAEPVGSLRHVSEPNWFLARPVSGPATEKTRFNRRALGNFLRDAYTRKKETIDAHARYSWEAGKQVQYFGFWSTLRKTLWRMGVEPYAYAESHPYELWALIGSLQEPTDKLKSGRLVPFAQASERQKALMTTLANMGDFFEREPGSNIRDIQLEPTEWMTNGLPAQTTFAVVGATDIALRRPGTSQIMGHLEPPRSAAELGQALVHEPKVDMSTYGNVEMGPRSQLFAQFRPIPGLLLDAKFLVDFQPSKPFKAADLPDDFVKAIQEAHRTARSKSNGSGLEAGY